MREHIDFFCISIPNSAPFLLRCNGHRLNGVRCISSLIRTSKNKLFIYQWKASATGESHANGQEIRKSSCSDVKPGKIWLISEKWCSHLSFNTVQMSLCVCVCLWRILIYKVTLFKESFNLNCRIEINIFINPSLNVLLRFGHSKINAHNAFCHLT